MSDATCKPSRYVYFVLPPTAYNVRASLTLPRNCNTQVLRHVPTQATQLPTQTYVLPGFRKQKCFATRLLQGGRTAIHDRAGSMMRSSSPYALAVFWARSNAAPAAGHSSRAGVSAGRQGARRQSGRAMGSASCGFVRCILLYSRCLVAQGTVQQHTAR